MTRISRRGFLGGMGAVAGAGVAVSSGVGVAARRSGAAQVGPSKSVPFHGVHQAGVLEPESGAASFAAFDVIAETREELVELMRTVTDRARVLVGGGAPEDAGPAAPAEDNGILGPSIPSHQLIVTVGMGSSLFDDRFGLTHRKPARLTPMVAFPNDNLNPSETHGDLIVKLEAADTDTVVHGLRDLTKHTRGAMQPRWRIDGFHGPPRPSGTPRNYLGFKDGIAHPDVAVPSVADSLIWVPGGSGASVDRGRDLSGHPHHPHAGRVLGPGIPRGAGDDDRAAQGQWRATRRQHRAGCPRLPHRPERLGHPALRPHPSGQSPHGGQRPFTDTAQGVQLRPGH